MSIVLGPDSATLPNTIMNLYRNYCNCACESCEEGIYEWSKEFVTKNIMKNSSVWTSRAIFAVWMLCDSLVNIALPGKPKYSCEKKIPYSVIYSITTE